MSVLAMGFVACDEYDEAIPQANEQKPIVEVKGLEVAAAQAMANPIDLNNVSGSIELIKMLKLLFLTRITVLHTMCKLLLTKTLQK